MGGHWDIPPKIIQKDDPIKGILAYTTKNTNANSPTSY
jgi:hypothetical protein